MQKDQNRRSMKNAITYLYPYFLAKKKMDSDTFFVGVIDITKRYNKAPVTLFCQILYYCPYFISLIVLKVLLLFAKISVEKSNIFNEEYYRKQLKTIPNRYSPLSHYLSYGWLNNLDPSPSFSSEAYLGVNYNLKNGVCPLWHYVVAGKRLGRATFTVEQYSKSSLFYIENHRKNSFKKSVLLITHELSQSGAPIALLNMSIRLKELNYDVVVFSPIEGPLKTEYEKNNIECHISPFITGYIYKEDELSYWKKYVSNFNYILYNCVVASVFVKIIEDVPINKKLWLHDGTEGFKCFSPYRNFNEISAYFDEIYGVGDYAKNVWQKYSKININNLYYGIKDVSANYSKKQRTNTKRTFLMAGFICKRKGHHILLDTLKQMDDNLKGNIEIYVVGQEYEEDLANQLKSLNLPCLKMVGEVSHEQCLGLLSTVDALLCPSIDDPMPIICSEAMMLSKPIVVSEHTGTASLIQDGVNGFIISPNNSNELLKQINNLCNLSNFELNKIGSNSKSIFDNYFSNETFDRNLLRIFK